MMFLDINVDNIISVELPGEREVFGACAARAEYEMVQLLVVGQIFILFSDIDDCCFVGEVFEVFMHNFTRSVALVHFLRFFLLELDLTNRVEFGVGYIFRQHREAAVELRPDQGDKPGVAGQVLDLGCQFALELIGLYFLDPPSYHLASLQVVWVINIEIASVDYPFEPVF